MFNDGRGINSEETLQRLRQNQAQEDLETTRPNKKNWLNPQDDDLLINRDPVEALYEEIKNSEHPTLKALAKKLKGYLESESSDTMVTLTVDDETGETSITF